MLINIVKAFPGITQTIEILSPNAELSLCAAFACLG